MSDYINVDTAEDTISIKVSLSALIDKEKETGLYVSYCPALALYSQGKTEKEAGENIVEAVELFIETCIEEHTLEKVLEDCGFSIDADVRSTPPQRIAQQTAGYAKLPPQFVTAKKINIPAEIPMMAYGS